ncbi:MAG: protein kinase, partial [Thermomicrobiales bacterium]
MSGSQTGSGNQGGVPALLGDRYEIEVEIGAGAFATTYRGHDRRLDRTVAIKVLSREYAKDPSYAQRFEREAQTAASISHGNVVDVYDFGQQGDTLYIVMQYVAGEDLKHLITREGALSPDRARDIAIQILDGLDAIHRAGIIHRDIKPQNILIGTDGRARVADFGIAQIELDSGLTTAGTTIGTAAYMAPEQAEGGRTTAETDLYAVGVVLYEMLTGALPFSAPTAMALMLAHIQQQPVPPSQRVRGRAIPPDLDGIVMQAMAKSPQDRFRSASAMMQALRGVRGTARGQEPTVALPSSPAGTSRLPAGPPAR